MPYAHHDHITHPPLCILFIQSHSSSLLCLVEFHSLFPSSPAPIGTEERETYQHTCHHASCPNVVATNTTTLLTWSALFATSCTFPVIVDTGATITITPFLTNFMTPLTTTEGAVLQDLTKGLSIKGSGHVRWCLTSDDGDNMTLTIAAFYVPQSWTMSFDSPKPSPTQQNDITLHIKGAPNGVCSGHQQMFYMI